MEIQASSLRGIREELIRARNTDSKRTVWFSQYHRGVFGWWLLDSMGAMLVVLVAWWLSPAYSAKDPGYADPRFSGATETEGQIELVLLGRVYNESVHG
jgi:hypothetical protein